MSEDGYMQHLLADGKKPQTAAEKIPILARGAVSDRAKETLNLVCCALDSEIIVIETLQGRDIRRGGMHPSGHRLPCANRRRREEMEYMASDNRPAQR